MLQRDPRLPGRGGRRPATQHGLPGETRSRSTPRGRRPASPPASRGWRAFARHDVVIAAVALATIASIVAGRAIADPSALWHIVHGQCVPDQQQKHAPAPCAAVDLQGGYAVLKDLRGPYQFLLIPTARVSGIDDPKILAPAAPNYWQDAWQARRFLDQRAGRTVPRDQLALAINSASGRSQNQLHIHVDCIRPDVRAALKQHLDAVGPQWAPFPVPLAGQTYRAMRIEQADLQGINPFLVLARTVPAEQMGQHTLVVAGVMFGNKPGFVLLDDRADLARGDTGHGEALQDHACMLLQ